MTSSCVRSQNELMFSKVGDAMIWEEYAANLLGILTDSNLSFNDLIKMICKKASQNYVLPQE